MKTRSHHFIVLPWRDTLTLWSFLLLRNTCTDLNENTPLHMAAKYGHKEIVKFLTLEMHCDPTRRNAYNSTALQLAAMNGHLHIIKFFISDLNCDPNLPGQYGRTLLHYASEFSHLLFDWQAGLQSIKQDHPALLCCHGGTFGHFEVPCCGEALWPNV